MSNQQRPFSWFRLAPFGRKLEPTPAPAPAPTPRPTALRAPAPQPLRPPAPQPRPTVRPPPRPAVTPPPPPARALFPGIPTTTAARSPTTSTAPPSPAKSIPAATSVPSSPAATSTFLPITSSSFTLRSPETKTRAPPSSSLTTSPFPKPVAASPPGTAAPPAPTTTVTASTATTTTLSPRTIKPFKESPQKYPETKPLFRPPPQEIEPKRAPLEEEIKKLMLGQGTAGNSSKMNEKATTDNKKVSELKILPRRLVTMIGENKGAIMVLSPHSTKKYYTNGFGGKSQTVGGNKEGGHTHVKGELGSNKKKEESEMNTMEMEESTLFINSNVQGVNNSILDDSSLTHHDPGFHIFFSTD